MAKSKSRYSFSITNIPFWSYAYVFSPHWAVLVEPDCKRMLDSCLFHPNEITFPGSAGIPNRSFLGWFWLPAWLTVGRESLAFVQCNEQLLARAELVLIAAKCWLFPLCWFRGWFMQECPVKRQWGKEKTKKDYWFWSEVAHCLGLVEEANESKISV